MGPAQTDSVEVSATTGRITVNEVSCKNITARSSTAKIHLDDVVARERLCAENTTGGVRLARCDAESITVKTTTGSVKGTLRSGKVFITDTSTGSIRVPQTTSGGTCEIATSTGDIEIAIEQ